MKYSRSRVFFVLTMTIACWMIFTININQVKADALVTQQAAIVKSTSLVTENVIKIPDKNSIFSAGAKSSVSRGDSSTEFNGVKGSSNGIAAFAYTLLGKPYVWGATGPNSFDCSGLAMYVYAHFGISIPHYTGSQFSVGQSVDKKDLQSGDLVFFNTYSSISHVGIYIGGGSFIHAPGTGKNVTISSLDGYYLNAYAGARRYIR
jgi:peptidoglycan DL-endopeptidase CwlO